jgi:hypothetical protein
MITENVKIPLDSGPNATFNSRERKINVEVQKLIDSYNQRGYHVISKDVVNKTSSHAVVKFTLQQMVRG